MEACNVIIVGGGAAGINAAITAADEGARVLVIEKTAAPGGCFAIEVGNGGTSSGAQTVMQFDAGICDDSPDRYYADCMRESRGRMMNNPEILRFYCERNGAVVDWMDRMGAYSKRGRKPYSGSFQDGWSVPRSYFLNHDFVLLLLELLQNRVDRGYIEVMLNTSVTKLIVEQGNVVGVKVEGGAGVSREYRAGSVVITTGGFGANIEMVRKYNLPRAWAVTTKAMPFNTGEGLIMCQEAGAQTVNLDHAQVMGPFVGDIPDLAHPGQVMAPVKMNKYPGAIWVNLHGQRLANEDCGLRSPQTRRVLESTPEQAVVVVLDQRIVNENSPVVSGKTMEWFMEQASEGKIMHQADTLDNLSRLVGIDGPALAETVARYNQFVQNGVDAEFGRGDLKYRIESPPFYAVKTAVRVYASSGGPATNVRQQVLGQGGRIIPGLYAAGEVTGYQGWGTGMYNMGCFVFGQQAGRMAARHSLYYGD